MAFYYLSGFLRSLHLGQILTKNTILGDVKTKPSTVKDRPTTEVVMMARTSPCIDSRGCAGEASAEFECFEWLSGFSCRAFSLTWSGHELEE